MKLDAKWTDDCQGKKDYDGEIISLDTRYYPSGGGFYLLDKATGQIADNCRSDRKPHAVSDISIRVFNQLDVPLVQKEFEGDSFEDIKIQVEKWSQEQYENIVAVVRKHFGV